MGNIVLFLYPTPNSRMLPSDLYRHAGWIKWISPNNTVKIAMATKVTFSLMNDFNISNISVFKKLLSFYSFYFNPFLLFYFLSLKFLFLTLCIRFAIARLFAATGSFWAPRFLRFCFLRRWRWTRWRFRTWFFRRFFRRTRRSRFWFQL